MQLKHVHVTNFRCIEDSEPFKIGEVTCLVGKNESGKTALLHALYRLKPHVPVGVLDPVADYPRRFWADFKSRHPDGKAVAVSTTWGLSDDDRAELRPLLGGVADSLKDLVCTRAYEAKSVHWVLPFSEKDAIASVLKAAGVKPTWGASDTLDAVRAGIATLGDGTPAAAKKLVADLAKVPANTTLSAAVSARLTELMPTFVYFSNYDRLPGQVALTDLQQREASNQLDAAQRTFVAFIEQASTTVKELATVTQFEPINAKCEAVSNKISAELRKYWKQNRRLKVRFSRTAAEPNDPPPFNAGNVFRIRIENQLHEVTVPFDDRSAGFVWFFSFLVVFSQVKQRFGDNVILLLDEPGTSLHGKAQGDLLAFIRDRLRERHQVIYTTHSPFMVPPDDLLSVRLVEDVVIEKEGEDPIVKGTKVGSDVLKVSRDTLFPLQGALGFEITQTLFVGANTLLVEGPSDLLFLQAFSEELRERGRTHLDARWTICPVGGLDKVMAFMSLFGAHQVRIAALVDVALGQKKKLSELEKHAIEVLRSGHVLSVAQYAGQPEADIEDVLGAAAYVEIVNATYGATIGAPAAGSRVVKYVEDQMRLLPALPEFNHYGPAEHLLLNRKTLVAKLSNIEDALARFEKLFTDLNALLAKP
jgi:energy-coupling factor transporter ATP-binding protein EcfA2